MNITDLCNLLGVRFKITGNGTRWIAQLIKKDHFVSLLWPELHVHEQANLVFQGGTTTFFGRGSDCTSALRNLCEQLEGRYLVLESHETGATTRHRIEGLTW